MPGVSLDVSSMKAADLKKELKARGLSVDGKKNELQERLLEALEAAEDDVDEETEKSLLEGGSPAKKGTKRVSISSAAPQVKVFKRDGDEAAPSDAEKTPQEKRAERFGITAVSSDAAKAARAARFGIVDPVAKKAERAARFGIVDSGSAEKKAARAARFGTTKSSEPNVTINEHKKVDIEQLKARAARFGEISSKTLKKASLLEKKQERAERFKSAKVAAEPAKPAKHAAITV